MNPTTEIIQRLSRPLDRKRVRLHSAPGRVAVPFLEDFDVIHTANQIFDYSWSFELLSEPRLVLWEQAVTTWDSRRRQCTPVLDPETGQPKMQRAGTVYLTGKITIELDGKPYTHADVGRQSFTGDTPEALELALSGAASDCLKRCLRQLGSQFGLDLLAKESAQSAGQPAVANNGNHAGSQRPAIEGVKPVPVTEHNGLSMAQAMETLCPVGSSQNPHWAGMPLGQVLRQPEGERLLAYLAGERFKTNRDPLRQQAQKAAQLLLAATQSHGG